MEGVGDCGKPCRLVIVCSVRCLGGNGHADISRLKVVLAPGPAMQDHLMLPAILLLVGGTGLVGFGLIVLLRSFVRRGG